MPPTPNALPWHRGRFHKDRNVDPKKYVVVREESIGGLTVYRAYERKYITRGRESTKHPLIFAYTSGSIRKVVMKMRDLNRKLRERSG